MNEQIQTIDDEEKRHPVIAIGLMIVILIGAVGIYFAMKPKILQVLAPGISPIKPMEKKNSGSDILNAKPKETKPGDIKKNLTLTNNTGLGLQPVSLTYESIILCNSLDEEYRCEDENKELKVKRGSVFYLYSTLYSINPNSKAVAYIQSVKILDEKNTTIFEDEQNDEFALAPTKGKEFPTIVTLYSSKIDPARKETIIITLKNKVTKEKTTKNITYEMI